VSEGFEEATKVELVDVDGPVQRYRAEVHDGWDIGGNANGGYVLAIAGRAMAEAMDRPPLSVTAHYLAPAPAGPCEVVVTTVRRGGRLATCTAALVQGERPLIHVLGTFGEPTDGGLRHMEGVPPDLPPYEACISRADVVSAGNTDVPASGLMDRLAVRVRPGDLGFITGEPSGKAETAGWFAFVGEQPVDEIGLLFVADAMAPPVFNLGVTGWVPTVELTVHVRMRPAPGPLRCIFRTRFIEGGTLDEDGEIWDSAGNLVAQSRQLALAPRGA
jgi:acyl-CoA thioesterase